MEGISGEMNITGYFEMNGATRPLDFGSYNLTNITDVALATKMSILQGILDKAKTMGAPVFTSSASLLEADSDSNYYVNGIAISNGGSTLYKVNVANGSLDTIAQGDSLFSGDQLYLNTTNPGFAAVLGYYELTDTVDPATYKGADIRNM